MPKLQTSEAMLDSIFESFSSLSLGAREPPSTENRRFLRNVCFLSQVKQISD